MTSKLSLNCNFNYNTAKGRYENPSLSDALTGDPKLDYVFSPTLDPANTPYGLDPLYNASYINNLGDYSDLNYDRIELSIGATYDITDNIGTTVTLFYDKFRDQSPFVYGDQDGDVAGGTATVMYKF